MCRVRCILATALLGLSLALAIPMKLNLMKTEAESMGAVCLDGSPAGYYFSPATNTSNSKDWQIYFQGGGWCYQEADCWERSNGNLGSSTHWGPTSEIGGIMSDNCEDNPDFCNFNRVHIGYCDGNSFSGNRDDPVVYNGKKLYFRGKRIIDAVLSSLREHYGFEEAETVLLTGCSAGGLATYLHADYVHSQLPSSVTKYKAVPVSGYFLQHNTVEGKPVYADEMKYIFNLANSTHGLNADCVAAKPEKDQWQCNFAQHSYEYIKSPIFPLNSAYDAWQTVCILTAEPVSINSTHNGDCGAAPGWKDCAEDPEKCTNTQMQLYNAYAHDFVSIMSQTGTSTNAGNGGFIYSCHTHCAGQGGAWNSYVVNGKSMQEAVSLWWHAPLTDPASEHFYWPCYYNGSATPRACNPSC